MNLWLSMLTKKPLLPPAYQPFDVPALDIDEPMVFDPWMMARRRPFQQEDIAADKPNFVVAKESKEAVLDPICSVCDARDNVPLKPVGNSRRREADDVP
jgi:hypothetical protein